MDIGWTHAAPSILAAFLASLVECVEALTIVLAVGSVRGWRSALGGSGAAIVVLLAIVAVLGPALARIPLHTIQIAVGGAAVAVRPALAAQVDLARRRRHPAA
jgi:Ca2+/H+ antiporter, TMEM165/GDT1 family